MLCSPKPNGFLMNVNEDVPYEMAIIGDIIYFQTHPFNRPTLGCHAISIVISLDRMVLIIVRVTINGKKCG